MTEPRREVLLIAEQAVMSDRNRDYGNPENNFRDIATLWNAWAEVRGWDADFTALDVAQMMIDVKKARTLTSPQQIDHYADMAGYAACGYATVVDGDKDDGQLGMFDKAASDADAWIAKTRSYTIAPLRDMT